MNKKILGIVFAIFLTSFVFAAYGEGALTSQNSANIINAEELSGADEILSKNPMQQRISEGQELTFQSGLKIRAQNENRLQLSINNVSVETDLELFQSEQQKIKTKLSNGINSEIKIMPNTASETALNRLRIKVCNESNNCTIQLKEVGQENNQSRVAYEIKAEKQAKVLALFQAKMQVEAQVDAETGEVIKERRPWWAFLATESEEQ
jgi:hypothetical protein